MKLTITREDGAVYKDGYAFHGLDLSTVPLNVHALQWSGEAGWIEYINESEFCKPANEAITELPSWANDALGAWEAAFDAQAQAAASLAEQATVSGAQTL